MTVTVDETRTLNARSRAATPVAAPLGDAFPAEPRLTAAASRAAAAARTAQYSGASTDAFGDYLRRIGKGRLLTAEEEVDLARRIEVGLFAGARLVQQAIAAEAAELAGEELSVEQPVERRELTWLVHDGRRAKNQFIEANLRLVVSIAKHYSGRGVPIMDLVQDGNMGLVRAVEKYDFMTGYKFSTYATWWIRQAIHRGMADKSRMIRIPVHTAEKLNKIKRIRRDLTSTLDRDPTPREIGDVAQIPVRDVLRLLQYDNEPISLHTPVGDGAGDMAELIIDDDLPQPDEYATLALRAADIRFFLETLPTREQSILRARFGLDGDEPRTLDQIAQIEGVTRERVRQIEKRALALLHVPRLEHYLKD
ncbi:RNA polymerase sigma factor RpoD/SigA [Cryobacterium sp. MLB-32]|uniref:sigma-70 family RNA polymerase sigma factor n=1 Tax=Cryobacterium sp. MLB-32 TaxID=1529318 RepID=UPI0009DE769E|nr:sigma-70 family RNA polymerase sigma factor [Cryobacterium sp. MLB-32]